MTLYTVLFYIVAALIVSATGLAVTRRNAVHAVVYLVLSFFGSAMLFYLLGAPFLAILEIIIYAGAIMVLFLFVLMMLRIMPSEERRSALRRWGPAGGLAGVFLILAGVLAFSDPDARTPMIMATTPPGEFGRYVFQRYWLPVEVVALLLFVALIAAMQLGKGRRSDEADDRRERLQRGQE